MPSSALTIQDALNYKNAGNLPEAEEVCWKLLEQNPRDGEFLQMLASIYYEQGKVEAAIVLLEKAIANSASNQSRAEYYTNLGTLRIRQGAKDEAARCFEKALMANPEFIIALYNSAMLASEERRVEDAMRYYERILRIDPTHALAHNNLGVLYLEKNSPEKAQQHCEEALKYKPDYANAYTNMGLALMRKASTFQDAFPYLQKAVELQPKAALYISNLTFFYARSGQFKEALECFRNAAALQPDKKNWTVLLDSLMYIQALDEFADQIKKLLADSNIDPVLLQKLYMSLAVTTYTKGRFEDCRYYLEQGKALGDIEDPEYPREKRWVHAFSAYLEALLSFQKQHPECYAKAKKDFYVIGESHALSPAYTCITYNSLSYRMLPKVITGCKVWHLINPYPNHYKSSMAETFKMLPEGAKLLITLGEIDCRGDEGIVNYANKHPECDLADYVAWMTASYVDLIKKLAEKAHVEVFIQGVPAPNCRLEELPEHERNRIINIIRDWNHSLQKAVKEAGMHFIDVYRLTATEEGVSNKHHHIDEFHLVPSYLQQCIDALTEHGEGL